ncbi:MAG: glycosyltransferase family 4 protein [Candidatus Omnitrophota bacterium]
MLNVVIAGKDFGFPFGGAASNRIRLISLGLIAQGVKVRVLQLNSLSGCYNVPGNNVSKGSYKGIDFEYTSGETILKNNHHFYRTCMGFKGLFIGLLRLIQLRHTKQLDCIYLYGRSCVIFTFIIFLCRAIRVPVILEITEWLPLFPIYSSIEKNLYVKFILRKIDGIIVISENIFKEVMKLCNTEKYRTPILKVPILVNIEEWQPLKDQYVSTLNKDKYILWCGDLIGYTNNAKFLIDVMAELWYRDIKVILRLIGMTTPTITHLLRDYQANVGLPDNQVMISGYIHADELKKQITAAEVLLLPLENIEKDLFRFPHKLGEYLASGRPVVSSNAGEISRFLKHEVNAILCKVNDVKDFATGIEILLKTPQYAKKISDSGRELCGSNFDYRDHTIRIADFICSVTG